MIRRSWWFAVTLGALATVSHAGSAQAVSRPLGQFTLGTSNSTGGDYEERPDYSIELLVALQFRGTASKGLLGGLAYGETFDNGSWLTCRVAEDGGCVPLMPDFRYAVLLIGADWSGPYGAASAAMGPSIAVTNGTSYGGAQFRADLSTPPLFHVALVLSPRLLVVANIADATLVLRSLNLGVRLRQ